MKMKINVKLTSSFTGRKETGRQGGIYRILGGGGMNSQDT